MALATMGVAGSGRKQFTRLSNGDVISAAYTASREFTIYRSSDNGQSFSAITTYTVPAGYPGSYYSHVLGGSGENATIAYVFGVDSSDLRVYSITFNPRTLPISSATVQISSGYYQFSYMDIMTGSDGKLNLALIGRSSTDSENFLVLRRSNDANATSWGSYFVHSPSAYPSHCTMEAMPNGETILGIPASFEAYTYYSVIDAAGNQVGTNGTNPFGNMSSRMLQFLHFDEGNELLGLQVAYNYGQTNSYSLYIARSDDRGRSWRSMTRERVLDFPDGSDFEFTVDYNGNIYFLHRTYNNYDITYYVSSDRGRTFSGPTTLSSGTDTGGSIGALYERFNRSRYTMFGYRKSNVNYLFSVKNNKVPAAPALSGPAYAKDAFTVTWTYSDPDGDPQTAYRYQISSNPAFDGSGAGWGDTGKLAGGITGRSDSRTPGTYYIRVKTYDEVGESPWSNVLTMIVDNVAPVITSADAYAYTQQTTGTRRVKIYGVSDNHAGLQPIGVWYKRGSEDGVYYGASTPQGSDYYADIPLGPQGEYSIDFSVSDWAGNTVVQNIRFFVDSVAPATVNATVSELRASSIQIAFPAFSDPAPSSGQRATNSARLYFQKWNGTTWENVDINGNGSVDPGYMDFHLPLPANHTVTGLTPSVKHRYALTYFDKSGNESSIVYKEVITNTLPVAEIQGIGSGTGYLINPQPYIRVKVDDAEGSEIGHRIQIATTSDFAAPLYDSTNLLNGGIGWVVTTVRTSGYRNRFRPPTPLAEGTYYVRAAGYDTVTAEHGPWTSTKSFKIQLPAWETTLSSGDTGVSRRTIEQLRTHTNAVRQARGLAAATFTDLISGDKTPIRAVHVTELRTAMNDAALLASVVLTWTDPDITPGVTERKGTHWMELRSQLESV